MPGKVQSKPPATIHQLRLSTGMIGVAIIAVIYALTQVPALLYGMLSVFVILGVAYVLGWIWMSVTNYIKKRKAISVDML